jgi:hypothetical protein
MTGMIQAAQSPAVLALAASVRETGSAMFPLLQTQPSGAMTYMADAGTLAMRAFLDIFCHGINPSFLGASACHPGSAGKSKYCDFPASCALLLHGSGSISLLLFERPAGSPDALRVVGPNP